MSASGVHRLVEQHAAARGEQVAIAAPGCTLTYRELNLRANAVARALIARGLRRGSRVVVRMDRSTELAVVLLAVLKAGASYMWVEGDADGRWPCGISMIEDGRPLAIDIGSIVAAAARPAPNLPILTRPDDIACMLPQGNAQPGVLVPHATITSLLEHPVPPRAAWTSDVAALDLWLPLMAGETVTVETAAAHVAAA